MTSFASFTEYLARAINAAACIYGEVAATTLAIGVDEADVAAQPSDHRSTP